MYPKSIQELIDLFSKFPTVGPRTAARFVFYLLKLPKEEIENFISSIVNLKKTIKICKLCFNPFEGEEELCEICRNNSRNKKLICVIEKETDLIPLEKTKKYNGLYFILGGTVPILKKDNVKKIRIDELLERVKASEVQIEEIIIATNPTTEGEATSLYLEKMLKPLGKKITRLGRGLPMGSELEYADEETLSSAIENRK